MAMAVAGIGPPLMARRDTRRIIRLRPGIMEGGDICPRGSEFNRRLEDKYE